MALMPRQVAEVKTDQLFRIETVDWTGGQIKVGSLPAASISFAPVVAALLHIPSAPTALLQMRPLSLTSFQSSPHLLKHV